jgi:hypothetical protein
MLVYANLCRLVQTVPRETMQTNAVRTTKAGEVLYKKPLGFPLIKIIIGT